MLHQNLEFPEYEKEDYGQTLGTWGVGSGCYIVLPVLGPSTLRDTLGTIPNCIGWRSLGTILLLQKILITLLTLIIMQVSKATSALDFRAKNIESFENLRKKFYGFLCIQLEVYTYKIDNKKF